MIRSASLFVVLGVAILLPPSVFALDGAINLGPEEIVRAKGVPITVPGYAVPVFEDWNDDRLQDLIVGEGGGGYPGKIRVYLNRGTEADPCFADFFYVQSNNGDLAVTPEGCLGCFPRVVDWNGDKREDLLVGLGDGTMKIFLNIADNNAPVFDAGTTLAGGSADAYSLDVGSRATPSLLDWDGDGMLDVVAGGLDGAIHVYPNCGCGGSLPPHFYTSPVGGILVQANGLSLSVPGLRSSPAFVDADGDGKRDILSGNTDGQIFFYKNLGTDAQPVFGDYTKVQSNGQPIDLPGSLRSRPSVCHWTGDGRFGPKDGYWDLLVGYGDGKVRLYRGIPKVADLNGDGILDGQDFTILVWALDQPIPPGGSPADLNFDGIVNNLDLRLFADLWLAEYGVEKK